MSNPATYQSEAEWLDAIAKKHIETVIGKLEFAKLVVGFKRWCTRKKGGSDFGALMKQRFGFFAPTTSTWVKIGDEYDKLFAACKKLPLSTRALYEIAFLSSELIDAEIGPGDTVEFVREVREWANSPRQGPLPKSSWKAINSAICSDFSRNSLAQYAENLGIDPTLYPTRAILQEACIREQVNRARGDSTPFGAGAEPLPDGTDAGATVEITALRSIMRRPLMDRLRWCEQYGFNACVVIGLPRGLSDEIYAAALCSIESNSRLTYHVRMPFGDHNQRMQVVQRAAREIVQPVAARNPQTQLALISAQIAA
jgi:RNase H-fold protein (predicted Holliday junction resolvase)